MSLKYRTSAGTSASNFSDIVVKVGDTLPVGSEIDYDGQTAPAGWQEVSSDLVVDSIRSKNLLNLSSGGLFPNQSGTVVELAGYYNAIIDVSNMTTLYLSGNFSLIGDGLVRLGYYTTYPKLGTTGVRAGLSANGTINVASTNYLLVALSPTSSSTIEQVKQSFMIEEGTSNSNYTPYQNLGENNNNYSTEEIMIGRWLDGKPLYRKVLKGTTGAVNTPKPIGTIANLGEIARLDGFLRTSVQTIPGNFVYNTEQVSCYRESNNIIMRTTTSSYASQNCYVIVEYTKTTD